MNHVGLFSGIGGFEEAFRRAGAYCSAVCEIEPQAQSVLQRHFPDSRVYSDVKAIKSDNFTAGSIDILTGGFPCQDLSVAGRREGLAGKRSGLWYEFIRIIGDHKPRWVVIENVPGLLSSNGGRDFAIVLRGLVECGYGVAYRILDSQFDGVAQRRRRVFVVASLGSGSCAKVLFESEGCTGDHPPRRCKGEGIAATITDSIMRSGGATAGNNGMPVNLVTSYKKRGGFGWSQSNDLAATLESESGSHQGGPERVPLIACRDVAQSLTSSYGKQPDNSDTALGPNLITAFQINASDEVRVSNVAYTLNTNGNATGRNSPTITSSFGVRRLTPLECERLQGFPDGWTATGADGKAISDSARYRMLGNAVCVPTVEWIARRIFAADEM